MHSSVATRALQLRTPCRYDSIELGAGHAVTSIASRASSASFNSVSAVTSASSLPILNKAALIAMSAAIDAHVGEIERPRWVPAARHPNFG